MHSSLEGVTNQNDFKDQLCFKVGGKQVCEKAFANIIGMADANGFKNKVWNDVAKNFKSSSLTGQQCGTTKHTRTTKSRIEDKESSKLEHAYAYILKVVDSMVMDKSAHANYGNHSYLPYKSGYTHLY